MPVIQYKKNNLGKPQKVFKITNTQNCGFLRGKAGFAQVYFRKLSRFYLSHNTYQPWFLIGLVCLFLLAACSQPNSSESPKTGVNEAKIEVTEDGFYRITEKALDQAGISFDSFSAETLALTSLGQSVPVYFDGEALVFYGQAPTSRYTASRPYILEAGDDGVLMAETAVSPSNSNSDDRTTSTLHLEENLLYESQTRQHSENDVWFWQSIRQGQSFPISFELPAVADGAGSLSAQLIGISYNVEVENDHDLEVIINEIPVGSIQFDGETLYTATLDIPAGTLKAGKNELLLDNTAEGATFLDIMQLNWLDLTYNMPTTAVNDQLILDPTDSTVTLSGFSQAPLLFDISDPAKPQQITDPAANKDDFQLPLEANIQLTAIGPDGFLQPSAISPLRKSNWHDTSLQADLLILTTDELIPSLTPLVAAREAEGLGVQVVPVADIYDEFGGGESSPDSLKQFIRYTHENWQDPKPRYLLLVGDATSDYRNNLDMAPQTIVPAPMVVVSFSGETVSDSILADVDDDGVPNMAVGRWPINTPVEAADLVARTLAYEKGTAVSTTFFAADGTESQFEAVAQSIATNSGLPEADIQILTGPQAEEVTAALNEGAWLATYIGHGSLRQWGKDNVFTQEAIANLTTETPPIMVQLTCLTGLFTQPEQTSLTEMLLTHPSGPVLSVAATSLTLSSNQEPFATSLIQHLNDPTVERMGDAFQAAKLSLDIKNGGLREISDTFALFGDPSAKIVRPQP